MKKPRVLFHLTRLDDLISELFPLVKTIDQEKRFFFLIAKYLKLNEWIMAVQIGTPDPKFGLKRPEVKFLSSQRDYYYYLYLLIRAVWDEIKYKKFSDFGLNINPMNMTLTTPADLINFLIAYDFFLEFELCQAPY